MNKTKILLMNIPNGLICMDRAPIAISRIIEGIDPSLNCDIDFYDLDYYRPEFEKIKERIQTFDPEIIGFSAILTTAYGYLKKLSLFIKENFPDKLQVLGGEMTIISNIILLKTKVDFCVTGEAEPTFSQLIMLLKDKNFKVSDKEEFKNIKGLSFLLGQKSYTTEPAEYTERALYQVNWDIIAKFTNIDQYMQKINGLPYTSRLHKSEAADFYSLFYPHNLDKKILQVIGSKGCVNRCTFCHRFFKGYKVIEPQAVIDYIKKYTAKYDIGLVQFTEENFGSLKRHTDIIIDYLKENKINWAAPAVVARTINEETAKKWRESGCININIGTETGSQKILDVMEKNIKVARNMDALAAAFKYKLIFNIGLMIGMPGETQETIEESITNLARTLPDDIKAPLEIRINWYLAIPGTEGYLFAQKRGLIGTTIDEEDKYLASLYDLDAKDMYHYLNFTDFDKKEITYWKYYTYLELILAYIKKHGVIKTLLNRKALRYKYALLYGMFPKIVRRTLFKYIVVAVNYGLGSVFEVLLLSLKARRKANYSLIDRSLRKINKEA